MQFWQAISFAPPDQLEGIAKGAEAAGFTGLAIPDHVVTPLRIESRYPYAPDGAVIWDPAAPYPEPWSLACALAQVTGRLRFLSYVYVLPLRDPFSAAKSISSAALLTGERVVAGVGAGWLEEEFQLLGRSFHERGARMDEMLEVMRALMTGRPVEHRGKYFDFPPVQLSPVPGPAVPIWVGGHSDAALRRAARADGWVGANLAESAIPPLLERLERARAEVGRPGGEFAITLAVETGPTLPLCRRLAALGVTGLVVPTWLARGEEPSSLAHKLEGLARFGDEVIRALRPRGDV
jgi:probable F420-dependent oxidoreductase